MDGLLTYFRNERIEAFTLDFPINTGNGFVPDAQTVASRLGMKAGDSVTTKERLYVSTPADFADGDTLTIVAGGAGHSFGGIRQFDEIFPDLAAARDELTPSTQPCRFVIITDDDMERLRAAIAATRPDSD